MDLKFFFFTLGNRTNSIFVTLDTCAEFFMILPDQNNQYFDLFYLNVPKGIFILRREPFLIFHFLDQLYSLFSLNFLDLVFTTFHLEKMPIVLSLYSCSYLIIIFLLFELKVYLGFLTKRYPIVHRNQNKPNSPKLALQEKTNFHYCPYKNYHYLLRIFSFSLSVSKKQRALTR